MKIQSCGWRSPRSLGRRSYGSWGGSWRRGRARMNDEHTGGVSSYMSHVSDAASFEAFNRHEVDPRLSAEALAESNSMIDFRAFAHDYPEKLFPLVSRLRPEFQELFAEYWILGKAQSFIAQCHGFIQTRTWQNLRIIEQAIGSLIILGVNPGAEIIRPILRKAGLDVTLYGSLTFMILKYAENQNYASVALQVGAPVPNIRKIFRPAIAALLANKDVKAVAVGAYLRSLTHQASLTSAGLSKRCKARMQRVKNLRFAAPPSENSPLLSFGSVSTLRDTPWHMLEISSDGRMTQISPLLRSQGKRIFGTKAAQIFAPVNADGELTFGYIFARSRFTARIRALRRVRGIAEMATICNDEGDFVRSVMVSDGEVQTMIENHAPSAISKVRLGDFVEILTGPASKYCGTVVLKRGEFDKLTIRVDFPTGRRFTVTADVACVKLLPKTPIEKRAFWGLRTS